MLPRRFRASAGTGARRNPRANATSARRFWSTRQSFMTGSPSRSGVAGATRACGAASVGPAALAGAYHLVRRRLGLTGPGPLGRRALIANERVRSALGTPTGARRVQTQSSAHNQLTTLCAEDWV